MKPGTAVKASASQQVQLKYTLKRNGLEAEYYFWDHTYLLQHPGKLCILCQLNRSQENQR